MSYILHSSDNYSQFKFYDFNRTVSFAKVKHIMESMKRDNRLHLFPVLVKKIESEFWVIDGQHRVEACKLLHIPIVYAIIEGDVDQIMIDTNTTISPWKNTDYLHYFCSKGNQQYIKFKNTLELYGLKFGTLMALHSDSCKILFKTGKMTFENKLIPFLDAIKDCIQSLRILLPEERKKILGNRNLYLALYEWYNKKDILGWSFKFSNLLQVLNDVVYHIPDFGSSKEYSKFFVVQYFRKIFKRKPPVES